MATPFLSSPVLIMRSGLLGMSAGGSSLGRTRAPAGRSWWIGPIVADACPASADDDDVARELRQSAPPASGRNQADEGLDSEGHPPPPVSRGPRRGGRSGSAAACRGRPTERWLLVRRQTDAVACPVAEM